MTACSYEHSLQIPPPPPPPRTFNMPKTYTKGDSADSETLSSLHTPSSNTLSQIPLEHPFPPQKPNIHPNTPPSTHVFDSHVFNHGVFGGGLVQCCLAHEACGASDQVLLARLALPFGDVVARGCHSRYLLGYGPCHTGLPTQLLWEGLLPSSSHPQTPY